MNAYGYTQIKIANLGLISKSGNHFYNYKGINFLCKMNPKNNNIAIIFHGERTNNDRIIFRGYDYEIDGINIVCFCDYLLGVYEDYKINWTLPTKKYNIDHIYYEIIGYLLQKKYDKVIFTGTSAGGYPSIKFACYFHEIALVSNSQLYLEKYPDFQTLTKMLNSHNDSVIYEDKQIEKIILENKPKKIIIYNNKEDSNYVQNIIPFYRFIIRNNLTSLFDLHIFSWDGPISKEKTHHHIQFPDNKKHLEILKNSFS